MRNQWRRLLLLRNHQTNHFLSPTHISRQLPLLHQVTSSHPISSLSFNPSFSPNFNHPFLRNFSTINEKAHDPLLISGIFAKPINSLEIKQELDANHVVITRDLVVEVLKTLDNDVNTAIKLFDWCLESDNVSVLSSNAYNLMVGILGSNGYVKEFWDMVDCMRKKGYGVKKGAFDKVMDRFEKDGLEADVERLKKMFSRDLNESIESASSRISRIVRREVWDENVEKELSELGVEYSGELVGMVLEKLSDVPLKGLIFFRWVEESGVFKHDQRSYNAMAVVLGREDCVDRFWGVVEDMRNVGCELEVESYGKVVERFIKRRMMKDSVSLYEVAMSAAKKPSRRDCTLLLKKVASAKVLDMELFSRVVKAFTDKGYALDDSMLDAVFKSLTSVGRMRMYNKVLDAMVKGGFKPSRSMQSRVAFDLSSSRLKDEANKFMVKLEDSGITPDHKTWTSLIEGHCVSGDLEKAKETFEKMVEKEGAASASYALDLLVNSYCYRDRSVEGCEIFSDLVNKKDLKPRHTTYKTLISKLLVQKGFHEALSLLGLMKNHGFPPFLDPFITYLVRRGTPDEAILFFKAMTVKNFPSTNVFLRVFQAFFEAGRHAKAQNLLAICPQYIRNHADVLNLFCSMKPEKPVKPVKPAAVAA